MYYLFVHNHFLGTYRFQYSLLYYFFLNLFLLLILLCLLGISLLNYTDSDIDTREITDTLCCTYFFLYMYYLFMNNYFLDMYRFRYQRNNQYSLLYLFLHKHVLLIFVVFINVLVREVRFVFIYVS